jgi:restriction system protein
MTAHDFELQVKSWLESVNGGISEFSAVHRERINGSDGEYEIDVSASFTALGGAKFHVLVECKKHKNPIKREMVQVLHDKKKSVGAQKAILVSTAAFQQGAIRYAATHGVALVQIVSGAAVYVQNSANSAAREIPEDAEQYAGLFYGENPDGRLIFPLAITTKSNYELAFYLGTQR